MNRGGSPAKAESQVCGRPSSLSQCWTIEMVELAS